MNNKKWDSDWIHFSKRARRGIIVLLIIFVIVAVSPRLYHNYFYKPPEYEIQVRPLEKYNKEQNIAQTKGEKNSRYTQPSDLFNPNEFSLEQWMNVGLSEKQASSILKYLASGAVLKVKSDLKKLYVVDDELYEVLKPKVDLPDSIIIESKEDFSVDKESYNQSREKEVVADKEMTKEVKPISVNVASEAELETIPGIGPYYAKEIVKLRNAFGGFISHDQLLGVYTMNEEKLGELKPFLIIDEDQIVKLNINTASEKELRTHPWISYDIAKSIVYFREKHRPYRRIDEILLSPFIDSEKFNTIKPYLKVE